MAIATAEKIDVIIFERRCISFLLLIRKIAYPAWFFPLTNFWSVCEKYIYFIQILSKNR